MAGTARATNVTISGTNTGANALLAIQNPTLSNANCGLVLGRSLSYYGQGYMSFTNNTSGLEGSNAPGVTSNFLQLGLFNAPLSQSLNITGTGVGVGTSNNLKYSFQVGGNPNMPSASMAVYNENSSIDPFEVRRISFSDSIFRVHFPVGSVITTNGASSNSASSTDAVVYVGCGTTGGGTYRSINASGTVNTNGADYAEYIAKADSNVSIAKGDVVGLDASGLLTTVFADSVAFAIKSTNPSYVGGDTWHECVGPAPQSPGVSASPDEMAAYEASKAAFDLVLEAERQKVDRVAFSGRVPVNVQGALPGDYIVPYSSNGAVAGQALPADSLTLQQYMDAVGRTISVLDDGRAFVVVKTA